MNRDSAHNPRGRLLLTDWVTVNLRGLILDGRYKPGEKLDPDNIAKEMEVSRTPVREAIRSLEPEGLIVYRPHHGAFVTKISVNDVLEIFEVRSLLEGEVLRQVALLVSDETLNDLKHSLDETEKKLEAGDFDSFAQHDETFHETCLSYAENSLVQGILKGLRNRIAFVRQYAAARPGDHMIEALKEHSQILDAMRKRNADDAAGLMQVHLSNSARRIRSLPHIINLEE